MLEKIRNDVEKSGLGHSAGKDGIYECGGDSTVCIDGCGWLPVLLVYLYVVFDVWCARVREGGAGAELGAGQASVAGAADGRLFGAAVEYYCCIDNFGFLCFLSFLYGGYGHSGHS